MSTVELLREAASKLDLYEPQFAKILRDRADLIEENQEEQQ